MEKEIIIEGFGDFLKKVGGFLSGSDEGTESSPTAFPSGRVEGMSDPVADSYSAEALKSSLLVTYNKLDQILEAIKRINKDDVDPAKSEIAGIISFIQTSYKRVVEIIEDARNIPAAERSRTLNDISKKLNGYILAGGAIDKWKEKWLGKFNSKLGGYEFYQKGKSLVQEGNRLLQEIQNAKEMQEEIKQTEIQNAFKRAKESVLGGKGEPDKPQKPENSEKGKDNKGKDAKEEKQVEKKSTVFAKSNPESVKSMKERLEKIGVKGFGANSKPWGTEDTTAMESGMKYLGTVSGKQYGNTEADIKDFFEDLGIFVKNRGKVLK
jgi:hypothetical protein